MLKQNILTTSKSLTNEQLRELRQWWETNYQEPIAPQKLKIYLCGKYTDFEVKVINLD